MGISGAKSKLRKGGGRAQGWFKLTNTRWEERTMQNSGEDWIVFLSDGESPESDSPTEIMLFLGRSDKIGDYVKVDDGCLISVDDDDEYEIPENSGVGTFFASLSENGVSDKIMNQVGEKPSVLDDLIVHIIQDPVLDADGEVKKNKAGYDISNTVVDKIGTEKDMKGSAKAGKKKVASKSKAAAKKKVVDEEDDEDEDEEADEEEEDDDEDDEEKPVRRRATKARGKK